MEIMQQSPLHNERLMKRDIMKPHNKEDISPLLHCRGML